MDALTIGMYRLNQKHPLFRGGVVDPRYLPHRQKGQSLLEYAQTVGNADIKRYLKEGLKWSRVHKHQALRGFLDLDEQIRRG